MQLSVDKPLQLLSQKDIQRFWRKVDKGTECWLWTRAPNSSGYGQFWLKGKMATASRVSWMIANGSIPEGLQCLHKCDNRRCVNPAHLFLGTNADNVADRNKKGRQAKGASHPYIKNPELCARGERASSAKLSEGQVRELKEFMKHGGTGPSAAERFGIAHQNVYRIVHGKAWRHIN